MEVSDGVEGSSLSAEVAGTLEALLGLLAKRDRLVMTAGVLQGVCLLEQCLRELLRGAAIPCEDERAVGEGGLDPDARGAVGDRGTGERQQWNDPQM